VRKCPHSRASFVDVPKLDEGSEHIVYLEEDRVGVLKQTRLGTYGEHYYLSADGRVFQQNSTPLDYLIRMRLWEDLFGGSLDPLRINDQGQIFSRQPFVSGRPPTQAEVDNYLIESGLSPVRQDRWLWKTRYNSDEFDVWVGDARADNFVYTDAGIVPIDLRLWFANSR